MSTSYHIDQWYIAILLYDTPIYIKEIHVYVSKPRLGAKPPLNNTNESSDPPYKEELRTKIAIECPPAALDGGHHLWG